MPEVDFEILIDAMESGFDIMSAVSDGDLDRLKQLLDKTDLLDIINRGDQRGRTALHLAACRGMTEVVKLLLDHQASVDHRDIYGNTALHWCGHPEIIQLFIEHGADVLARNNVGATPRTMACRRGVSQDVLYMFHQYETSNPTSIIAGPSNSTSHHNTARRQAKVAECQSIWYEFCSDLGPRKLFLVILTILLLSLYVAFTITGITRHIDSRVPISSSYLHKVEL